MILLCGDDAAVVDIRLEVGWMTGDGRIEECIFCRSERRGVGFLPLLFDISTTVLRNVSLGFYA